MISGIVKPLFLFAAAVLFFSAPAYSIENNLTDKAAEYICTKAKDGGKTRLAVYPFTTKDGKTSSDSEGYATKIIEIILTKGEFRVIDPEKILKTVEEQEKGLTGLVDPDTAPETGQIIGADAMVFGITGDGILQIRIVDAVTGEVIGATVADAGGAAKINNDDFKTGDNKNRFITEQLEIRLGQLYLNHPKLFLFVTANDEEMKYLESEFPQMTTEMKQKTGNRDQKSANPYNRKKKKLLQIREDNPGFNRKITGMREKAISGLKSKKKNKRQ